MVCLSYKQSQGFTRRKNDYISYLCDDIIILEGDLSEKQLLKKQLSTKFEMNDFEKLKYCIS